MTLNFLNNIYLNISSSLWSKESAEVNTITKAKTNILNLADQEYRLNLSFIIFIEYVLLWNRDQLRFQ